MKDKFNHFLHILKEKPNLFTEEEKDRLWRYYRRYKIAKR